MAVTTSIQHFEPHREGPEVLRFLGKGFSVPSSSTYTAIEAPKGEIGVFLAPK